jgi:hypothetical protein
MTAAQVNVSRSSLLDSGRLIKQLRVLPVRRGDPIDESCDMW